MGRRSRQAAAFAEALAGLALIAVGIWSWSQGVSSHSVSPPLPGNPAPVLSSYDGSWIALACLLVAAGALAVVDALRRAVLSRAARANTGR